MYRTFIFYRAGLNSVSPAVHLWWPETVINLFKQFPVDALHYGSFASHTCVDFIIACSALEKTKYQPIEVFNLRVRWEGEDRLTAEIDTPARTEQWRAWLFTEIERMCADVTDPQQLPILVDIDPPHHVTQGGTVLFQRHSGRHFRYGDPLWMTPAEAVQMAKERGADQ